MLKMTWPRKQQRWREEKNENASCKESRHLKTIIFHLGNSFAVCVYIYIYIYIYIYSRFLWAADRSLTMW